MSAPLVERLGLGTGRAVANARQAALDRQAEDRMIAELVEKIARRDALAIPAPVARAS